MVKKNSKYFLNLEKRSRIKNTIFQLSINDGHVIINNKDILYEIRNFYSTLYSSFPCNPALFISSLPDFTQEVIDTASCDGPLTLEECHKALSSMHIGKSPGSDGLSTDFYKFFWPLIGNLVINSLNFAFEHQSLSSEQSRGIITLIHKPDKDANFLTSYRPISLLNTDYKIEAKALAIG